MRIFVTGATGFLGTAICERLKRAGNELTALGSKDCDLTLSGTLERFNAKKYDQLYHLAAWTQAGDFCLHHPGEQWIINQQINTNVLEWWQRVQPQAKLICMGTSCAYDPALALVEENYLAGQPTESLYTYAMTKRMLYLGLLSIARQYGLKYLCLVPSTLYGPRYHLDGRQMHFIFDLIRKIFRGKHYQEPVVLWGDGYQQRELVYVDDFVKIAIDLVANRENELVNIGSGEEFPIRYFARMISDIVGYEYERIQFDTSRYVGERSKCLDVKKLRVISQFSDHTSLEDGLRATIKWFGDAHSYEKSTDARA